MPTQRLSIPKTATAVDLASHWASHFHGRGTARLSSFEYKLIGPICAGCTKILRKGVARTPAFTKLIIALYCVGNVLRNTAHIFQKDDLIIKKFSNEDLNWYVIGCYYTQQDKSSKRWLAATDFLVH